MSAPATTSAAAQRQQSVTNPIIAEIAGIDSLPLTQERSRGFKDALATTGSRSGRARPPTSPRRAGSASPRTCCRQRPGSTRVWNHDDDQGIGVLAAIQQAGRSEFFMVGGAGSANAMRAIQADNTVLKATVTYPPTMAAPPSRWPGSSRRAEG